MSEEHKSSEYEEMEIDWATNIPEVVQSLEAFRDQGKLVKCKFNGVWLYSDTVSLDSAYKAITGLTYAENKKRAEKEREETAKRRKKEEEQAIARIPEWIDRGHKLLPESKWNYWDEIVPIRAKDLYHGMELDGMLEIQEILLQNEDDSFERAHRCLQSQGHSGMSFALIRSMINEFCYHGEEFAKYIS